MWGTGSKKTAYWWVLWCSILLFLLVGLLPSPAQETPPAPPQSLDVVLSSVRLLLEEQEAELLNLSEQNLRLGEISQQQSESLKMLLAENRRLQADLRSREAILTGLSNEISGLQSLLQQQKDLFEQVEVEHRRQLRRRTWWVGLAGASGLLLGFSVGVLQ